MPFIDPAVDQNRKSSASKAKAGKGNRNGELDFDDFDFNLESPVKRNFQQQSQDNNKFQNQSSKNPMLSQQNALSENKKSDKTKPSTDKQMIKNQLNHLSSEEEVLGGRDSQDRQSSLASKVNLKSNARKKFQDSLNSQAFDPLGSNEFTKPKDLDTNKQREAQFRLNLLANSDDEDFGTGEFAVQNSKQTSNKDRNQLSSTNSVPAQVSQKSAQLKSKNSGLIKIEEDNSNFSESNSQYEEGEEHKIKSRNDQASNAKLTNANSLNNQVQSVASFKPIDNQSGKASVKVDNLKSQASSQFQNQVQEDPKFNGQSIQLKSTSDRQQPNRVKSSLNQESKVQDEEEEVVQNQQTSKIQRPRPKMMDKGDSDSDSKDSSDDNEKQQRKPAQNSRKHGQQDSIKDQQKNIRPLSKPPLQNQRRQQQRKQSSDSESSSETSQEDARRNQKQLKGKASQNAKPAKNKHPQKPVSKANDKKIVKKKADSESDDSDEDSSSSSDDDFKIRQKKQNTKSQVKNQKQTIKKTTDQNRKKQNKSESGSSDESERPPNRNQRQQDLSQVRGYQPPGLQNQNINRNKDMLIRKSSGPHEIKGANNRGKQQQNIDDSSQDDSELDVTQRTNLKSKPKEKIQMQKRVNQHETDSEEDSQDFKRSQNKQVKTANNISSNKSQIAKQQPQVKQKSQSSFMEVTPSDNLKAKSKNKLQQNQNSDQFQAMESKQTRKPNQKQQDQDISARNPPSNSMIGDSDEEDIKQLQKKLNQGNSNQKNRNIRLERDDEEDDFFNMSQKKSANSRMGFEKQVTNVTEIEMKKPRPPNQNKIDFYSQEKPSFKKNAASKQEAQRPQRNQDEESEEAGSDESSSVEILEDEYDNSQISKNTQNRQFAKGFTKQKAYERNPSSVEENDEEDRNDQVLDTNPENQLLEQKKKNRMTSKIENFFDFTYKNILEEEPQPDDCKYLEEQGVPWTELNKINHYFEIKKRSKMKNRRRMMKYQRVRNLFFTSKWFVFFHMFENVLFWMVVLVFPIISVIGCEKGFQWMSHVGMGFYLALFLVFDSVFAFQYITSENTRFELKGYKFNKTNRSGKCCHMLGAYFYCILEMIVTSIGLMDIYCDMAFAVLTQKEGIYNLSTVAIFSMCLIVLPKLYSFVLQILIIFCYVREEDKKRKYVSRILILDEFRMQAANVDYIQYEKSKLDLQYGLYKFLFEDIPMFVIKCIFLTQYDCGKLYSNGIVYCGLLMAIFNTYFGLLYRFASFCYNRKKIKGYKSKVEVKVSILDLAQFGFRNIRDNIKENRKIQSIIFTGQNYQYQAIDQSNIKKYEKFVDAIIRPERIEFFEINKVYMKTVREEKQLFKALDRQFKNLRYLTIQECKLCKNFILQLKIFLDGNDTLARLSLIHNRMPEDNCYEILETCLEHPNLEVIQLAERNYKPEDAIEEVKSKSDIDKGKNKQHRKDSQQPILEKPSAISVCRGIQFRLQQSESLKLIEIRYLQLSRQILQAIFKGLAKNKQLQRLVLTNNALKYATQNEYKLLGESLKVNQNLQCLDLQENNELNDNIEFHKEIIEGICSAINVGQVRSSQMEIPKGLKRVCITTEQLQVKAEYLNLLEERPDIVVFIGNKVLEDVDIQE